MLPSPYCCQFQGLRVFSALLRGFRPLLSSFSAYVITFRLWGSHGGTPTMRPKSLQNSTFAYSHAYWERADVCLRFFVTPMRCFRLHIVVILEVCMPRSHNITFPFLTLQFIRRVCLTLQYPAIRCFALLVLALYCPLMVDRCYVSHALSVRRQLLIVQEFDCFIDHWSFSHCLPCHCSRSYPSIVTLFISLLLDLSHLKSLRFSPTLQVSHFLMHHMFVSCSYISCTSFFVTLPVMTVDFIAVLNVTHFIFIKNPVSHTSIYHASIYRVSMCYVPALHFTSLHFTIYRFLEPRSSTFQCITRQFDHTSMSPNPICVFYHLKQKQTKYHCRWFHYSMYHWSNHDSSI